MVWILAILFSPVLGFLIFGIPFLALLTIRGVLYVVFGLVHGLSHLLFAGTWPNDSEWQDFERGFDGFLQLLLTIAMWALIFYAVFWLISLR
ncbi:hypothetical protein KAZ57_00090 [Patescibacteria group bacterium]|nr:hypothetical protein [Patescibacteria group bacterium]